MRGRYGLQLWKHPDLLPDGRRRLDHGVPSTGDSLGFGEIVALRKVGDDAFQQLRHAEDALYCHREGRRRRRGSGQVEVPDRKMKSVVGESQSEVCSDTGVD
jgi:hypothetical protein